MARSGAQRKQQRKPQTRSRGGSTRTRTPSEFAAVEAEMFFPKLRRQAKWMFVFLALVFGVGFVVFGVGSGGGAGIGDILNGGSSSSGPSESHARDKIAKNPADAAAWRELATALTNQNKTDEAIPALERYVQLRPHDSDALKELAGYYEGRA